MKKDEMYQQIEERLVKYRDLIDIEVNETNDTFVTLPDSLTNDYGVIGRYEALGDMRENFPSVPVRSIVRERLDQVDLALKKIDPNLQLVTAYGFRSLEIQQKYFDQQKKIYLESAVTNETETVDEVIHRMIAVPSVAGHPTGGAVDVCIEDKVSGTQLDFGTPLFSFESKDVYTFSPFVSEAAKKNRFLLRDAMMAQGFAPYDGEWWHFSYGDKEWAFYYQQEFALYEQKQEKEVLDFVS